MARAAGPAAARSEASALWLLLVLAAGCAQPAPDPMRLGTVVWPGHEPLFLARTRGSLPDSEVRLVEYSSLSEVNRAFRNGALDAAGVTLDMALALAQQGFEPRVVLVLDVSVGADAIVARPGLRDLRSLAGRRVGVEQSGVSAFLLGRALEQAGMRPSQVHIVWTPVEEQVRSYREGGVDAVASFEPFVSQLEALGARRLFDSSQVPGEVLDVLVVRRAYLEAHPEAVARLLDAWFAAARTMEARPQAASLELSGRLGMTPEDFRRVSASIRLPDREENLALLGGESPAILPAARAIFRVLQRLGLVRGAWPEQPLLDARALQRQPEEAP